VKAADCGLGGNWATALLTLSVRLIATLNKSPKVYRKKVTVPSPTPS
jgi:hypothetical protein